MEASASLPAYTGWASVCMAFPPISAKCGCSVTDNRPEQRSRILLKYPGQRMTIWFKAENFNEGDLMSETDLDIPR